MRERGSHLAIIALPRRAEDGLKGFYQGTVSHGPTAFEGVPAYRQYGGEMEVAAVTFG